MELSMHERKKLSKKIAARYRRASKKEKMKILDEFVTYTGYNRNYAAYVLSKEGKSTYINLEDKTVRLEAHQSSTINKGGRPKVYDENVVATLKLIWQFLDYPCGKLLKPMLSMMISYFSEDDSFKISPNTKEKLLSISLATIDRSLKAEKQRLSLKGKSQTKPGSLLKSQIPVRVYYSWDEMKVGFFELDTVSHSGPSASGEFCQSLTVTDVYSGWTEVKALRNKANRWVKEKIIEIKESLTFELLGIDSDNGGEFINQQLLQWCEKRSYYISRYSPLYISVDITLYHARCYSQLKLILIHQC